MRNLKFRLKPKSLDQLISGDMPCSGDIFRERLALKVSVESLKLKVRSGEFGVF